MVTESKRLFRKMKLVSDFHLGLSAAGCLCKCLDSKHEAAVFETGSRECGRTMQLGPVVEELQFGCETDCKEHGGPARSKTTFVCKDLVFLVTSHAYFERWVTAPNYFFSSPVKSTSLEVFVPNIFQNALLAVINTRYWYALR